MTPARLARIRAVLAMRQPDLTVITDEVHKQRNIAAIVRTCDAVGIGDIHCAMPEQGYQIYAGTAASANKWVEQHHYASVAEPLAALKARGHQIVAAHLGDDALDYRAVDFTRPTAVLLGAEVKGVSQCGQTQADVRVYLPMMGMVSSYNVSVAAALLLGEAQRQREAAGLYRQPRLDSARHQRLFFRWAHPKLAEFCDREGLAYPAVDAEGEVIDLPEWYRRARGDGGQAP